MAPMSGLAPDARLAVTDLGNLLAEGLQIPTYMRDYYAPAWAVGARVHSDSWGEETSAYTEAARQVDEAVGGATTTTQGGAAAMGGLVPVFAAGNTGAEVGAGGAGVITVMAPSNAKVGRCRLTPD